MSWLRNLQALFTASLVFLLSFVVAAQSPVAGFSVIVTPSQPDWKYKTGENAFFSVSISKDGDEVKDGRVHVEIGPEKMPATTVIDTVSGKEQITINGGTLLTPGFLRCIVTANLQGKRYKGMATVAFSPEGIMPTSKMPENFMSFWRDAIDAGGQIPLNPRMNLLNDRSSGLVNVYEISFQSYRSGSRMYGILCVPKKKGKYPAILKLPGAGVRAYRGDTALAEKGYITLELGIHGIPLRFDNELYYNLASGALFQYYFSNLENRDRYYYKTVYTGCVRAIDFLMTLAETDTSRIAVYGGSQGGALAIVTAALHPHVKFVAALYPAMSDLTGYLHGRAGGWPHMFSTSLKHQFQKPEMIKTAAYYDVVNFAQLLTVPGWYSWGYNDEVCPPTTAFAVYNTIPAAKELFITKETGHWLSPAQAEASTNALLRWSGAK